MKKLQFLKGDDSISHFTLIKKIYTGFKIFIFELCTEICAFLSINDKSPAKQIKKPSQLARTALSSQTIIHFLEFFKSYLAIDAKNKPIIKDYIESIETTVDE